MSTLARTLQAILLAYGLSATGWAAEDGYVVQRTDSAFADVLEGLKAAIQERGMYINNIMDISGMHERTGKDLGMPEPIYTQAQSIEFCSALLSREMTRENPARIVNCPFIISVYERAGETGTTYVVHRNIPRQEREASPTMTKLAVMLTELSEAAIAW